MTENEFARIVIDLCFKIHQKYGPGLFESVYEKILFYELSKLGLFVQRQHPVSLQHEDLFIGVAFRADLIIERKLLVELKSLDVLPKNYYKQVITYLRLTGLKLGLLINFNVVLIKDGIHRIVNNL